MSAPIIIGLTGSIGMGKSTVARMLRDRHVPVFDADAEVRRVQGPGGALIEQIEAAFPGSTGPDGVDRPALGAMVFGDSAALDRLEQIVHPAVEAARALFLADHAAEQLVVLDIPLLFERGGHERVDVIIVVSAGEELQAERVLERPGMNQQKFSEIRARQTPDAEKRARADFVIDTSGSFYDTRLAVDRVLACVMAGRGA